VKITKPLHSNAALAALNAERDPFPKPGTKWRPLHKKPHQSNQPISIRRFISLAKQENKS
jgi:hypothetical protein